MKRESVQEHRARLRAELAAEPENAERWLALGRDLVQHYTHDCIHRDYQGRDVGDPMPYFHEAIECFRQAARLAPDDPRPWNCLGGAYRGNGMPKPAIESYLESVKRDPNAWMSRLTLAELYQREGAIEEAERHVDFAFEMHPDNFRVQYAKAHLLSSGGKHAEAIPLYKKVLESEPRVRQALAGLGLAYAHLGQFELGEAYIWQAIEICDDCYDVNYALAKFYDLAGRTEEAAAMRRRAHELYREVNPPKKSPKDSPGA